MSRGKRKRRLPNEEGRVEETSVLPPSSTPLPKWLLVLLVFGLGLIALLIAFLVLKGDDSPNEEGGGGVPSGLVAIVRTPTGEAVSVSEAEFARAVELESERSPKTLPQRGNRHFEDLQASVLGELLAEIWDEQEAPSLGVSVSNEELAAGLAQFRAEQYPTDIAYQRYLRKFNATPVDIEGQIRRQLLHAEVREKLMSNAAATSDFAAATAGNEFAEKWKAHTQCAPEFLDLVGSGGTAGAGYVIEVHCQGGAKGKGALEETIEEFKKTKAYEQLQE
jgi:SurA-like protein